MNRTVNLTKRVQTCKGLRYCTVVLAMNGRVRADLVIVNGREERHPEGAYYLEWWEGAKRIRLSVGKDAADAGAPPFLVGGYPCISPVHMRAVRFTNRGYFFPKFLDTL